MPVPKKKHSKSRRDMRRSQHDKMDAPMFVSCPNCKESMRPHRICGACGYYKSKEVILQPTEAKPADDATPPS
jgi:large subunit ribosomal protein L32